MNDSKQSFDFTFFTEKELDEKFESVIQQCQGITSHEEIIKIINRTFFNRQLQIIKFESGSDLKVYRVTQYYPGFNPESKQSFSYNRNPNLGRANLAPQVLFIFYSKSFLIRNFKLPKGNQE